MLSALGGGEEGASVGMRASQGTFSSSYLSCIMKKPVFYAPNFEKVGSILVSACPCVRPCVCACVRPFKKKIQARVLKFHICIPGQKIA